MAAYAKSVSFKDGYLENLMEHKYKILAYFIIEYEVSKNALIKKLYFKYRTCWMAVTIVVSHCSVMTSPFTIPINRAFKCLR